MTARVRRSRRLLHVRLPRLYEVLAATLVIAVALAAIGQALRLADDALAPAAPSAFGVL